MAMIDLCSIGPHKFLQVLSLPGNQLQTLYFGMTSKARDAVSYITMSSCILLMRRRAGTHEKAHIGEIAFAH